MASARGAKKHRVTAQIIWPVRIELAPFKLNLRIGTTPCNVALDYPAQISLAGTLQVSSLEWSRLTISWSASFIGTRKQFLEWASRPAGQAKLLAVAEEVQTEIVDRLYFLPNNDRAIVSRIRHFGPRDWIHADLRATSHLIFQLAGSYLSQKLLSRTIDGAAALKSNSPISFEDRTLCRAADLAEFGYSTESLLLAFSVLDAAVQTFLRKSMSAKGITEDSAEQLLRSTTTKRLSTYLDPVLQLTTGSSLAGTDNALFKRILSLNTTRNDAIHNGKSVSRAAAIEACKTVHETLLALNTIQLGHIECRSTLSFTQNPI